MNHVECSTYFESRLKTMTSDKKKPPCRADLHECGVPNFPPSKAERLFLVRKRLRFGWNIGKTTQFRVGLRGEIANWGSAVANQFPLEMNRSPYNKLSPLVYLTIVTIVICRASPCLLFSHLHVVGDSTPLLPAGRKSPSSIPTPAVRLNANNKHHIRPSL